MTVADVLDLAAVFGDDVLRALPRTANDLFPPEYGPLLSQWRAGRGQLPKFRSATDVIWSKAIDDLGSGDLAIDARRQLHLQNADTYRARLAEIVSLQGVDGSQFEYIDVPIANSRSLLMFTEHATLIVVCDLNAIDRRAEAAGVLVDVIHGVFAEEYDEKIALLVCGDAVESQLRRLVPQVLSVGQDTCAVMTFETVGSIRYSKHVSKPNGVPPDVDLRGVGWAKSARGNVVVGIRISKDGAVEQAP